MHGDVDVGVGVVGWRKESTGLQFQICSQQDKAAGTDGFKSSWFCTPFSSRPSASNDSPEHTLYVSKKSLYRSQILVSAWSVRCNVGINVPIYPTTHTSYTHRQLDHPRSISKHQPKNVKSFSYRSERSICKKERNQRFALSLIKHIL